MSSSSEKTKRTISGRENEKIGYSKYGNKVGLSWQQKRSHVYNPVYSKGVVYEPADPDLSSLRSEGSVRNSSPVRFVRCDYCEEEHPEYSTFCPNKPCTICFKPQHSRFHCPFLQKIPRGANYDRVKYHVVCGCGDLYFDEENWVCTNCRGQGTTLLRLKGCAICYTSAHHCTEECPNDKIAAAGHRAIRDYMRLQPHYKYPDDDIAASRATREFPEEIARVVRAATEHALREESGDS